jgi:CDP-diacylglycerol--inositol 3-phosphatidyltransferase
MVTDRVATNALVVILSHLYPSYIVWFLMLCCLDLASHWMRMYSSFVSGSKSHKDANQVRDGTLLTLYYTNRIVLGLVCMGNEAFYVLLYVWHFYPQPLVQGALLAVSAIFMFKQYINLVQLYNSSLIVAESDAK